MLRENQVRHLLTVAEQTLGVRLDRLRKHLASRDPVPYIWEVVVLDALLRAGAIARYETDTDTGLTPDFLASINSCEFWVEAAYVRDRFVDDDHRLRALLRRLAFEEQHRGIAVGSIEWRADGNKSPAGYRKVLPAEHDLPKFFRLPELTAFFKTIGDSPTQSAVCDLRSAGYTLAFTYIPRHGAGPFGRTGGSVVSDVPSRVEEHSVFRRLQQKGRRYSKLVGNRPFVVCVGSEDSRPASSWQSVNAVSLEKAVDTAFREHPALSAAVVVSIESNNSIDNYGRIARVRFFDNPLPLGDSTGSISNSCGGLTSMVWTTEEGGTNGMAKTRFQNGAKNSAVTLSGGSSETEEGFMVELPVEIVLQMLSGVMSDEDFRQKYRLDVPAGPAAENPFRRAWEGGQALITVTFIAADPRLQQGSRLRFDFGPPEEMILQVRRSDAQRAADVDPA